jgi:hypothetical protein
VTEGMGYNEDPLQRSSLIEGDRPRSEEMWVRAKLEWKLIFFS